ncbi:MAG: DMT family transporter [Verrucomicrobia bacterium]|nr:DMT family transporter [Verrucomicrobiota bacterium]
MNKVRQGQGVGSAVVSLAAVVLIFASIPVFLKYFTHHIDAWTANGLRYGVSALFWLPYVLLAHFRGRLPRGIWAVALIPTVPNFLSQIFWAMAPYHNDAAVISFVVRSNFLFIMLFSFLLLHEERESVRQPMFWVGAVGTAAGILVMYWGGVSLGSMSLTGLLILISYAASWAMYAVVVRRFMKSYSIRLSFGVISIYTSIALLLLMFIFGDWRASAALSVYQWAMLLLSGLLGIAFGHVLFYKGVHAVGPIVTESIFSLIPFVAAFYAFVFLGERMRAGQWVGGFLLVGSCFCLLKAKRSSRRT